MSGSSASRPDRKRARTAVLPDGTAYHGLNARTARIARTAIRPRKGAPTMLECVKCGHRWPNETRKCPNCQTRRWNGTPASTPQSLTAPVLPDPKPRMKCSKCSYEWNPKVDSPKNCPNCKAPFTLTAGKKTPWGIPKRLAVAHGPVTLDGPEGLPEVCDWTGLRIRHTVDADLPNILTDITGLGENEHYPVFEQIPAPMSRPTSDGSYILRGWIRRENV